MLTLIGVIMGILGVSLGIKLPLMFQLAVVLIGIFIISSQYVNRMEIAGIIPIVLIVLLIFGMAVGDVVYYFNFYNGDGSEITQAVRWMFTP